MAVLQANAELVRNHLLSSKRVSRRTHEDRDRSTSQRPPHACRTFLHGWGLQAGPVVSLRELKAEERAVPLPAIEDAGYGAVWRGPRDRGTGWRSSARGTAGRPQRH